MDYCTPKEDKHDHNNYSFQSEMERIQWQLPERVINSIGVKPGMSVADIGAGTGFFTIRLANRVGDQGIVYANEIFKQHHSSMRHSDFPNYALQASSCRQGPLAGGSNLL